MFIKTLWKISAEFTFFFFFFSTLKKCIFYSLIWYTKMSWYYQTMCCLTAKLFRIKVHQDFQLADSPKNRSPIMTKIQKPTKKNVDKRKNHEWLGHKINVPILGFLKDFGKDQRKQILSKKISVLDWLLGGLIHPDITS